MDRALLRVLLLASWFGAPLFGGGGAGGGLGGGHNVEAYQPQASVHGPGRAGHGHGHRTTPTTMVMRHAEPSSGTRCHGRRATAAGAHAAIAVARPDARDHAMPCHTAPRNAAPHWAAPRRAAPPHASLCPPSHATPKQWPPPVTPPPRSLCHAWPMTTTTDDHKHRHRTHDNDPRDHDAHTHDHNHHTGRVVLGPPLLRRACGCCRLGCWAASEWAVSHAESFERFDEVFVGRREPRQADLRVRGTPPPPPLTPTPSVNALSHAVRHAHAHLKPTPTRTPNPYPHVHAHAHAPHTHRYEVLIAKPLGMKLVQEAVTSSSGAKLNVVVGES